MKNKMEKNKDITQNPKLLSEEEKEYFKLMVKENASTRKIAKELYEKLKNEKPNLKITKKAIEYLLDKLRDKLKNGSNGALNRIFESISFGGMEKCHYCNGKLITTGKDTLYGTPHIYTTYYYCLNCGKSHYIRTYYPRGKYITEETEDVYFVTCWSD